MSKPCLQNLFSLIALGDSVYNKQIVNSHVNMLFHDTIFNVQARHESPCFDDAMYQAMERLGYEGKTYKTLKTFTAKAGLSQFIKFNAILYWDYNKEFDAFSNLRVEIVMAKLTHLTSEFDLFDWLDADEVRDTLIVFGNRVCVVNWVKA